MTFGWINLVNAAIVGILLAISLLGQKKSSLAPMKSRRRLLNVGEQVGRCACMALLVLPLLPGFKFGFSSVAAMTAWLGVSVLLLGIYAFLWTQMRRGIGVLYALALVPAALFLCCGLLLRHWALVGAAVLFGVCHALILREHTKQR